MPDITGGLGEFCMTIEVTRKDTGKVETFDLIGKAIEDGTDTLNDGA